VMTAEVVTVAEDAPFKELARLMAERDVTALPVLGTQGRVAGIVAEVDLLRKEEYQEDPSAKRMPRRHSRARRARAAGLTARAVMTSPPVTISPEARSHAGGHSLGRLGCRLALPSAIREGSPATRAVRPCRTRAGG